MRANQPDPQGTLYLGDGCWGMGARTVDKELRPYLAKAASIQHFWCVDVTRRRVEYRAVNKAGQIFDVYPTDARGTKAAEKVYESLTQAKSAPAMK
jgi:transposase-like protein